MRSAAVELFLCEKRDGVLQVRLSFCGQRDLPAH